jgi:hypothetical protein
MAARANWVRMTVASGGTGTITLAPISNVPSFAKKHGTGSTVINYVIFDPSTGLYETGTGSYNGTSHELSARTVIESYTGAAFGTSAIDVATSAVVFPGPTIQDVTDFLAGVLSGSDNASEVRTALELGSAAVADTEDFAAAAHNQAAETITSGTLAVGRLPAFTGDVTIAAGTGETVIPDESIGTIKLGSDVTAFAKEVLVAADEDAGRQTFGFTQTLGGTLEGDVAMWDGSGFVMERQRTSISFRLPTPVNGTETITDYFGFEGVPIGVVPHLESGSATLTLSINGTPIGGLSGISVGTGRTLTSATADLDPWTASSYMTFTLSEVTGATKFSAAFIYDRVR